MKEFLKLFRNTFQEGLNAVNNIQYVLLKVINRNVNIDFADEAALSKGKSNYGLVGNGENRAKQAVDDALNSPFFDKTEIKNESNINNGSSEIGNDEVKSWICRKYWC